MLVPGASQGDDDEEEGKTRDQPAPPWRLPDQLPQGLHARTLASGFLLTFRSLAPRIARLVKLRLLAHRQRSISRWSAAAMRSRHGDAHSAAESRGRGVFVDVRRP